VVCLKFELTCSSGSQFEQYTDKEDILFSKSSTKSRFKWSVHVSSESSITIVKPAHTTSEFRPDIQTAPNSACPPHLLEATSTCLPTPSPLQPSTLAPIIPFTNHRCSHPGQLIQALQPSTGRAKLRQALSQKIAPNASAAIERRRGADPVPFLQSRGGFELRITQ
jgi:hypothetical protein